MDAFLQRSVTSLGRQVPQVTMERAAKRIKAEHDDSPGSLDSQDDDVDDSDNGEIAVPAEEVAPESSLPPVKTDKEAIEEYEIMRASQGDAQTASSSTTLDKRKWVKGKSSIYVDAFNLALDTVLEDESHLFSEAEVVVFAAWRQLDYEAQYLYVRLFLRKTDSWHRTNRLGYYDDISDPEAAIQALQTWRLLPEPTAPSLSQSVDGIEIEESSLGDSFTFTDTSEASINTVDEAASLLGLDELKTLAKDAKVQGKNKSDLLKAFCKMANQQSSLLSLGLRRTSTNGSDSSRRSNGNEGGGSVDKAAPNKALSGHYLDKILDITGPCIRVTPKIYKLFERVHLVFYRTTEWTEKSLTTIILAKISRRNFPDYIVCRSSNIFGSRFHLLEFEAAMRKEYQVDSILESNGPPTEAGLTQIIDIAEATYRRWQALVLEEQHKEDHVYELGEGAYMRRFTAAHTYTRIIHKAGFAYGRLKRYLREHAILVDLLAQRLFHPARRGAWYQRKALLEEHYMHSVVEAEHGVEAPLPLPPGYGAVSADAAQRKKQWMRVAQATCEAALQDNDCHVIFHHDLQRRLVKLERRLRIPRRLQHDFDHVRLARPVEHTVEGVQLKTPEAAAENAGPAFGSTATSTRTMWLDELGTGGACTVEEMCLSWYRSAAGGRWKGYHCEGGVVRTLFALLFWDVLFGTFVPGVFQTPFQTCPLDLHTDAFYAARASAINARLAELANGGAGRIMREVDARERPRRAVVVGLRWEFELDDLLELAECLGGPALATLCKVMAQEYRQRGGGMPDLVLWRTGRRPEGDDQDSADEGEGKGADEGSGPECVFAEVKSANDRLSDTQRLWIHVLAGAGVGVVLCNAVAREVRLVESFA